MARLVLANRISYIDAFLFHKRKLLLYEFMLYKNRKTTILGHQKTQTWI